MFQQFYAGSNLLHLPLIGMGIFIVTFLAVLVWVIFGLRNNPMVERMAALPLEDESIVPVAEEAASDE